jgi:hypothetical protein
MQEFSNWLMQNTVKEDTSMHDWLDMYLPMLESTASRYSVEVNFRSKTQEVLEAYAKIVLGYVSAAMKQNNYHVKHVFEQAPVRILVSSRNWDDGEWVGIALWNPEHSCFMIAKGFYNKEKKTVSIQSNKKCGDSASDITSELRNTMHSLKGTKDRYVEKLKPVPLKRGPKR